MSKSITLNYDEQHKIAVSLAGAAAELGITFADFDDFIFMLKTKATDSDADAVVSKTLGSGIERVDADESIIVTIDTADFADIENNIDYLICIGMSDPTMSRYKEPDDYDVDTIKFVSGRIRG